MAVVGVRHLVERRLVPRRREPPAAQQVLTQWAVRLAAPVAAARLLAGRQDQPVERPELRRRGNLTRQI